MTMSVDIPHYRTPYRHTRATGTLNAQYMYNTINYNLINPY